MIKGSNEHLEQIETRLAALEGTHNVPTPPAPAPDAPPIVIGSNEHYAAIEKRLVELERLVLDLAGRVMVPEVPEPNAIQTLAT